MVRAQAGQAAPGGRGGSSGEREETARSPELRRLCPSQFRPSRSAQGIPCSAQHASAQHAFSLTFGICVATKFRNLGCKFGASIANLNFKRSAIKTFRSESFSTSKQNFGSTLLLKVPHLHFAPKRFRNFLHQTFDTTVEHKVLAQSWLKNGANILWRCVRTEIWARRFSQK